MPVKLCVLASGSSGNCTLIRTAHSAILIDAGLPAKEIERRLAEAGCSLDQISGICVSHEHSDHICGLAQLHGRHEIPVYTNRGTSEALQRDKEYASLQCRIFSTGQPFPLGDFTVEPFSVPHDAYEPVGFTISAAGVKVGVVTDMGMATTLIRAQLRNCHAVVLESNHDEKMLRDAKRPEYLKQRILGRQGHLSNKAAAELLSEIAGPDLDAAFLAHLSRDCNKGELALQVAQRELQQAGHHHVRVLLTYPDKVSEMWSAEKQPTAG